MIRHLPVASIVILVVVPVTGYYLFAGSLLPSEAILPTVAAIEVVFLANLIQSIEALRERRKRLGSAIWELHHELTSHVVYLNPTMKSVKLGTELKQVTATPVERWEWKAPTIEPVETTAWDRFLAAGMLNELRDVAPDQVASNLYRYYHGVRGFNRNVDERNSVIGRLFETQGLMSQGLVATAKGIEQEMERWLLEGPDRIPRLMRELQHVLFDLGRSPASTVSLPGESWISDLLASETERYAVWRERHGDPRVPPSGTTWNWSEDLTKKL